MRNVLLINPNTSLSMTAEIETTARRVFQSPWQVSVKMAPAGPESLESWTDYHLASVCTLPLLDTDPAPDGVILACFGDPGLFMLKEICPGPVVGIAEAAMTQALLIGGKFGILAGMTRAVELMDSMVRTYGLEARYAGTQPLNMRVLDFENRPQETLATLVDASQRLHQRGADVLLLGCAGLTAFVANLQARTNMPVIDPVEAGCRALQLLLESRLNTSHTGLYTRPVTQHMHRLETVFSPEIAAMLQKPRQG